MIYISYGIILLRETYLMAKENDLNSSLGKFGFICLNGEEK